MQTSAVVRGHPKRKQKAAEEMVKDLKEKVFPTRTVNYVAVSRDGKKARVARNSKECRVQ